MRQTRASHAEAASVVLESRHTLVRLPHLVPNVNTNQASAVGTPQSNP